MKNFILVLIALGFTASSYSQKVAFMNVLYHEIWAEEEEDVYPILIDSDSTGIEYYKNEKLIKIERKKQYYRDYFLNLDKETMHVLMDSIITKINYVNPNVYLRLGDLKEEYEEYVQLPKDYHIYVRYTDKTFERFIVNDPYYIISNDCLSPEDVFMNNMCRLLIIGGIPICKNY